MAQIMRTIQGEAFGEIEEKKSRFLAILRPMETQETMTAFVAEMRKKYWDARHHCSACVLGEDRSYRHSSDDGEPSGTAGKPMLDVLDGAALTNVGVVVIRYFGGTLLGTGGLVRAYGAAVRVALEHCEIEEKTYCRILSVTTDYHGLGKLQHLFRREGILVLDSAYEETAQLRIAVSPDEVASMETQIQNATGGKCAVERLENRWIGEGTTA